MSNPAVFLDRDGTLIEHFEYLTDPNDVQVIASVAPALKLLRDRGFYLVMVTNQSAIARGILTEKKLTEIHGRLKQSLSEQGVYLDKTYFCPFHPEGAVEKYRRDSELRKPRPGMLTLAAQELDIDLSASWMVGDDDRDILAGQAANCRTILLESYGSTGVRHGQSDPDYRAVNLQEAANLIVRHATHLTRVSPAVYAETAQGEEQPQSAEEEITENTTSESDFEQDSFQPETEDNDVELPVSDEVSPRLDSSSDGDTHSTLRLILREMQAANREKSFTEFSIAKLLAGVFQMIAVFCMVLAFYFGNAVEPDPQAVQNSLMWAVIFQLLTLTWFLMHRH